MGSIDWLTTLIGIHSFGAAEANPLLAGMVNDNILVFSGIKLLAVLLVGFMFYLASRIETKSMNCSHFGKHVLDAGYSLSLVALTAVVTNNVIAIAKLA